MKCQLLLAACLFAALSAVHADEGAPHVQGVHQQPQASFQPRPQAPPLPYQLRRQSGMDRARSAMMGFMRSIMDAGSRFRRMASERLATMFARRSAPSRRSQQRVEAPNFRRQ